MLCTCSPENAHAHHEMPAHRIQRAPAKKKYPACVWVCRHAVVLSHNLFHIYDDDNSFENKVIMRCGLVTARGNRYPYKIIREVLMKIVWPLDNLYWL